VIRALICSLVCATVLSAAPRIAGCDIDVSTTDGQVYAVRMRFVTTGEPWTGPSHTIERVAGARLFELRGTVEGGLDLEPGILINTSEVEQLEASAGVDRMIFRRPLPQGATYELSYSVAVEPGHVARLPLAVPEIPVSGDNHAVQIRVTPPPGYLLSGDAFPTFERNRAELANIPSHIEVEIDTQPRRSTPALLSDLGVIALLVCGIFVRVILRRRGATA
jgi:hypothetical protein